MCFFRKKRKIEFPHRYEKDQSVTFHYQGDVTRGYIYSYSLNESGEVVYQIMLGGECPRIIENIAEKDIRLVK